MLSTKSIGASSAAGAADYYEELAQDDYYTAGGEPPGIWHGKHAESLGLSGQLAKGDLKAALQGFHPHTGEALASNAGNGHHGGYDFTFSAPKSVSVIWATADKDKQMEISAACRNAVCSALDKAERDGSFFTRHGHAAEEKRAYKEGLTAALFEHGSSRELDPQLHIHAVVANLTPDGRRIDFNTLNKMQLGASFRVELAAELRKIGFDIARDKTSFRVCGVDKKLEKDLSTRRAQIVAELQKIGMSGGKAAGIAALSTRVAKGEVNRAQLFETTRAAAAEYGLDANKVRELCDPANHKQTEASREMPSFEDMAAGAVREASTLTSQQLTTAVLQEAQGRLSLAEAEQYLDNLKASESIMELVDKDGKTAFTSKEMYDIERKLFDSAVAMRSELTHAVNPEALAQALASKTPSEEQQKAIAFITGPERLAVVQGVAGAGKSYMLEVANEAWTKSGYTVHGAALAGKAGEGLEKSAGIESKTIHKTLAMLDNGTLKLDEKSIVVIDEGGMVGSKQMQRLQSYLDEAGAKLVVVGETSQLQPIDAGGAMRAQIEACGDYIEMVEIRRQQSAEERAAGKLMEVGDGAEERAMVMNARSGDYDKVLEHLDKHNRIHEFETREELLNAMAKGVVKDIQDGHSSIALAETRAEVKAINQGAREEARAAGLLTSDDTTFKAEIGHEDDPEGVQMVERQFAAGDRIIFLKNDQKMGVMNGTTGTVERAENGRLSVRLDDTAKGKGPDGKPDLATSMRVAFTAKDYSRVDHGYGMTVHKAQGVTVDRTTYAPGFMTHRELAYVALSRGRDVAGNGTAIFITKDQRDGLARSMSVSQAKFHSASLTKVEKYQGEIDKATGRIAAADKTIADLEAKISAVRNLQEQAQAQPQSTTKEQQHGTERNYGTADRNADAQRAIAAIRERDASEAGQKPVHQADGIERMRDLSGVDLVQERGRAGQEAGRDPEVLLSANERNDLAAGRAGDHGVRRTGAGDSQAHRGADQAVSEKALAKLETQLVQVRAEKAAASTDELAGRIKQGEAMASVLQSEAAREAKAETRINAEATANAASFNPKAQRDADLARRALEAHKAGVPLPTSKEIQKGLDTKTIGIQKDSSGRVFYEFKKTGVVVSKDLNAKVDSTTSRNVNHLGLTATKYVLADKKIMGVKIGTTVLKSGGTLKSEVSGALREQLNKAVRATEKAAREAEKAAKNANGSERPGLQAKALAARAAAGTAKVAAMPANYVLKKGESWQKAGALEGVGARIQMKYEQSKATAAVKRELEAKIKAYETAEAKSRSAAAPAKEKAAGPVKGAQVEQTKQPESVKTTAAKPQEQVMQKETPTADAARDIQQRAQVKANQARIAEDKIKAADATAKHERDPSKAASKEGAKETRAEITKDLKAGKQLPPSKAHEASKELAQREPGKEEPTRAKEKEAAPANEKAKAADLPPSKAHDASKELASRELPEPEAVEAVKEKAAPAPAREKSRDDFER